MRRTGGGRRRSLSRPETSRPQERSPAPPCAPVAALRSHAGREHAKPGGDRRRGRRSRRSAKSARTSRRDGRVGRPARARSMPAAGRTTQPRANARRGAATRAGAADEASISSRRDPLAAASARRQRASSDRACVGRKPPSAGDDRADRQPCPASRRRRVRPEPEDEPIGRDGRGKRNGQRSLRGHEATLDPDLKAVSWPVRRRRGQRRPDRTPGRRGGGNVRGDTGADCEGQPEHNEDPGHAPRLRRFHPMLKRGLRELERLERAQRREHERGEGGHPERRESATESEHASSAAAPASFA